jgi:hypothetical protein
LQLDVKAREDADASGQSAAVPAKTDAAAVDGNVKDKDAKKTAK